MSFRRATRIRVFPQNAVIDKIVLTTERKTSSPCTSPVKCVFHLLEFNSAYKHHNKSNSFQYKLERSLYCGGGAYNDSTFFFCFRLMGLSLVELILKLGAFKCFYIL